ncbi:capsular biosynthesis protein [Parazoarcus communis]|uniref:capsular polysaccharide export protein, LipB/KpsS family n=1 Tax=Parazoarcus communis TaxID=41977 RepID=UPI000D59C150|nr:capsular biosynthesis protein [Parazoarcus communis]
MKYKRILTLSYYHPMARFFCAIEDEWKKIDSEVEFLHISVFPSAYVYFLVHGRRTVSVSWISALGNVCHERLEKKVLDEITLFHVSDPGITKDEVSEIHEHACKLFYNSRRVTTKFSPDLAIISGDTRMPAEVIKHVLSGTKTEILYFEQGPYRTTILDRNGVNANCSFREKLGALDIETFEADSPRPNLNLRWNNKLYSALDKLSLLQSRFTGVLPPEVRGYRLKKVSKKLYNQILSDRPTNSVPDLTVLLAMQVPEDANNIYHNPLKLTDISLLQLVKSALLDGMSIIVREHPLYRMKYSQKFYEEIEKSNSVFLSSSSLDDDLNASKKTVTINSMTALDSFAVGNDVALLGDSFFDKLHGMWRVRSCEELRVFFNSVCETESANRIKLINAFKKRYLLDGHFSNQDQSFVSKIVKKIHGNEI